MTIGDFAELLTDMERRLLGLERATKDLAELAAANDPVAYKQMLAKAAKRAADDFAEAMALRADAVVATKGVDDVRQGLVHHPGVRRALAKKPPAAGRR